MFDNLELIIFQKKLSKKKMANELNMKYNTFLAKLAGKQPIKLDEAFKIQSIYAPDKTIEWLFDKSA